jgi:RNA polymerase-binding transcription factor DksA
MATPKSVADAARDLEAAVQKHRFGVLHVYDLKETLTRKGHPLAAECRIFEVCNPQHASQVLQRDMRVNMALPCRISVYEDRGATKIGTVLPTQLLRMLSPDRELAETARAVETTLKAIIADAAAVPEPRQALGLRRAALAREIEAGVARRAGERDGNVPDTAETAAEDVARDVGLAEVDRDVAELEAIDAALERLDTGTYGRCLDCGAAIEPARLAKNPEVPRCVPCQQKKEQKAAARIARL